MFSKKYADSEILQEEMPVFKPMVMFRLCKLDCYMHENQPLTFLSDS